jgi:hypothetical protein
MLFSTLPFAMLSLIAPVEAAQVDGTILRIEGPDIYAAIGRSDGVTKGQTAHIYRSLSLKKGSRKLTDTFRVGSARVIEVGSSLTLLRVAPGQMSEVSVGDLVRLSVVGPAAAIESPTVARGTQTPDCPEGKATPRVAQPSKAERLAQQEASHFRTTFLATAGATEAEATKQWKAFLLRWPRSPAAAAIEASLAREANLAAEAADLKERQGPEPLSAYAIAPKTSVEGAAIPVSVAVRDVDRVASTTLFYRQIHEPQFRFLPMKAVGDTAFGASIPAEVVSDPGIQWYVQVSPKEGELIHAGGSPASPSLVVVTFDPVSAPIVDRSQVSMAYEHVDFLSNYETDEYSHAEVDVLYRLGRQSGDTSSSRDSVLYSIRMGFGVYDGVGGNIDTITELVQDGGKLQDTEKDPVGYNYGYTELEFKVSPFVSLITRGIVGVDSDGMATGANGRIRLGSEEGTNMEFGAAKIGNIGNTYMMQFAWDTVEKIPMSGGVHVTNHPGVSADDYGVRLVYEARYAFTDWIELGGRVGYNLRNINHAGFSYGLSGVFSW